MQADQIDNSTDSRSNGGKAHWILVLGAFCTAILIAFGSGVLVGQRASNSASIADVADLAVADREATYARRDDNNAAQTGFSPISCAQTNILHAHQGSTQQSHWPEQSEEDTVFFTQPTEAALVDLSTRLDTVELAADDGDETDLPWLLDIVYTDDNPQLRVAALESLIELSIATPRDALLTAARDPSKQVREAAMVHLIDEEPEYALYLLQNKLADVQPNARLQVLQQMAIAGDDQPLRAYLEEQGSIAQHHSNRRKRATALRQLGRINSPEAEALLSEIASSATDAYTRSQARKVRDNYF